MDKEPVISQTTPVMAPSARLVKPAARWLVADEA
jgi:hypothetical protein